MPLLVNNDRISDGGPSRRTCLCSCVIVRVHFFSPQQTLYFFQIMTVFPIIL